MLGWKKAVKAAVKSQQPQQPPAPSLSDVLQKLQQLHHVTQQGQAAPLSLTLDSLPAASPTSVPHTQSSPSPSPVSSAASSASSSFSLPADSHRRSSSEAADVVSKAKEGKKKKRWRWYHVGGDDDAADAARAQPPAAQMPGAQLVLPPPPPSSSASASAPLPSAASSLTTFLKPVSSASAAQLAAAHRRTPPPIDTSFTGQTAASSSSVSLPVTSPLSPSLKLSIDAIIARPAFASSFRSFLVTKYCQENVDFLLAVERWTAAYTRDRPHWREAKGQDEMRGADATSLAQSAAAPAAVQDIVNDKSGYVALGLDGDGAAAASASSPSSPSAARAVVSGTNLPGTALDIYQTYILLTGANSVNIPAHTRQRIEQTVSSLQQEQRRGGERLPLASLLTPHLFSEAVTEIKSLLEREWLTRYQATEQYGTLLRWMDKADRRQLTREQQQKARKRLQEQLRRVATAVRTPVVSGFIALQAQRDRDAAESSTRQRLQPDSSAQPALTAEPVCAPSPRSALKPSAARQTERSQREDEDRDEDGVMRVSVSESVAAWCIQPEASPQPVSPLSPSSPSPVFADPQQLVYHPVATPQMHLTPRRAAARHSSIQAEGERQQAVNLSSSSSSDDSSSTPDSAATSRGVDSSSSSSLCPSSSASSASSSSSAVGFTRFHTPSESSAASAAFSSSTERKPRARSLSPLPFHLEDDDDGSERIVHSPLPMEDEADNNATGRHSSSSRDSTAASSSSPLRASTELNLQRPSPEPSTASPCPSPAICWQESSRSEQQQEAQRKDSIDGEGEVDEREEDADLASVEDGQLFFSVQVVDDSDGDGVGDEAQQRG